MPPKHNRLDLWIIILVFALGFVLYGNTLNGPFLFDDVENIVYNSHIKLQNLSPAALANAAFDSPIKTRPIAYLSFAVNYLAHGFWLPGYHLTNIFIHCLTGMLLFLLIKGTFNTPALKQLLPPEKATQIAAISSLLWLLNPAGTQSVSYIVQRMNSLSAMFFLVSMLLYLRWRTVEKHRPAYLAGCLVSGLLALGSKEVAATLPPVIFLYEWYFFQDLNRLWLKKRLPLLGIAGVVIVFIGWLYLGGDFTAPLAGYQQRDFTVWERLMTEPRVVCRYVVLIFFPHPGLLNLDHDYPLSTGLLHPPATLLAITTLAALFLAAILSARRHRLLSFAILWFFLNLLIESSIIPLEIIFDHRTYLPSMLAWPPLLTFAWQLPDRKRKAFMTGTVLLLIIFATWTFERNQLWANEVAINRDIVLKSPNKPRAHTRLGIALIFAGQEEEGVRELKYTLELDPNNAYAYLNLGAYYLLENDYKAAINNLLMATSLMPSNGRAYNTLSTAYYKDKQYAQAITAARAAITAPDVRDNALLTLGLASSETGDLETAISSFRELSANHPNNGHYLFNLGRALEKSGRKELALQKYAEALEIAPDTDKKVIRQAINELRNNLHQ